MFRVQILGLAGHAQGVVVAANLHAFAAPFAKVGDENAEDSAGAGSFLFGIAEDGRDVAVGEWHLVQNGEEFSLGLIRNARERVHFRANDFVERTSLAFFDGTDHLRAGAIFDSF